MNRFTTPVQFGFEKNIVSAFSRVVFGSSGAPILDTNNSKGICNVAFSTPTFGGTTSSGSSTITSVSSFQGLFTGMTLSGGGANGTIGTMTAATKSIVMTGLATSGVTASMSAIGGQYVFQFGTQAGVRLDGYFKLLEFGYLWDESTGSASGSGLQLQLAPSSSQCFVVQNLTQVRTIPATLTSNSTDCTLTVQVGNGTGVGFVAQQPVAGEVFRCNYVFGNSSAV